MVSVNHDTEVTLFRQPKGPAKGNVASDTCCMQ